MAGDHLKLHARRPDHCGGRPSPGCRSRLRGRRAHDCRQLSPPDSELRWPQPTTSALTGPSLASFHSEGGLSRHAPSVPQRYRIGMYLLEHPGAAGTRPPATRKVQAAGGRGGLRRMHACGLRRGGETLVGYPGRHPDTQLRRRVPCDLQGRGPGLAPWVDF